MKGVEFIKEEFPTTAKQLDNKVCFGLNDIGYLCEQYHKAKLKNNGDIATELLEALQRVDKAIDSMKLNDRFGHTQMYIKEVIEKALKS